MDLDIYTRQVLWASAHGSWGVHGAEVLGMHRLVTCGHRLFLGPFAILLVLLRSLGHLKLS